MTAQEMIEADVQAALKRLHDWIARSAGQHIRALKKEKQ